MPPSDAPSLETDVSRTSSTDRLGDTVNSQSSKSTLRGDERRTKWWDLAETEAEEEMEQLKARLGRCTPRAMESAMTTVPVSSSPTSSAPSLTLQTSGSRNPSASTMSHLHGHRAIRDGDKLILTIPLGDHFTVDEIRVAETRNAVCVKASRQVRIPESGDNSGVSSRNSYSGAGCATPEAVGLAGPAAVIAGTGAGETAGRGRLGNLVRQQFYKEYEASDCLPRPETLSYTLTDGLLRIEVRVLSKDSV
ncbi:unnamed protein product [Protopolystoma xenopodis]|uniref:SHSP domain-containing protein n=1 Tax=Protopolystoma xenopodis TaxID=117903 RepID=A0A3S5CJN6_9PLAT|nr:unnamed protein product [Protopolystoma xenopodis]